MQITFNRSTAEKISLVSTVCLLVGLVLAALVFQLYLSQNRALDELDSLQETAEYVDKLHEVSFQMRELQRLSASLASIRTNRMESGFRTLYMDIQGNLSALVPLIRDEERVQLLHGMILQLSLYRENYVDAITSRAFIDRAIRNDLPALTDQITNQLNNSATINNNYEQLAQLVALSQLNLTAYAYRADAIDEEEILKSIMLVKQQIEQGMDDPETKASLLQPLNEYQNLINQVVSQTHNYLYLIKVILAGHANEYVYLSESLNTSIHNSFNLETENARQQLTLARRNTLVLSAALFLTIIASVLALALFLHRLAYLEKTLKDFSQRHKMIIDQANTGIAEVGLDGSWITVNKKLCEMFGYPEPELTSMSWQDITHPDDLATDAALVQQIINGEINQYTLDKRYIRKDGSFFWARLKVSGHKNSSGEPQNFISNIESIDDLKQKENLLLKTNTGLEKQVEERLRDLERSNAELEQFAYVASHDLQEPLRMVSSYMQLIEDRYRDKLDEDGKEFIQYAVDGALRMQTLIKSLLEYSRVGSEQGTHEPVEMESVLALAKQNLASIIASSQAVITSDELPMVSGNKSQLIQLMQNLISNAIKYSVGDSQPEIHISASRVVGKDHKWQFSVRDNGIGFDPAHAEKIFVIFRRLHTKEAYAGTGIGLAICKKIIEGHDGQIWADSSPGNGSTFYFTLNS